jgi:hypothetical protein
MVEKIEYFVFLHNLFLALWCRGKEGGNMSLLEQLIQLEIAEWNEKSGKKRLPELYLNPLHIDTRRSAIIGSIFTNYFEDFLQCTPQETEEENDSEFAPVEYFLTILTEDEEYMNRHLDELREVFDFGSNNNA